MQINSQFHHYEIENTAIIATQFDALEKFSKVAYRIIGIAEIITKEISHSWILVSQQFKDLVFIIESSRFFVVANPVLFPDKNGETFFKKNTLVKCCERVSLTFHTFLKMVYGGVRVNLLNLGKYGKYAIGNVTVFRTMIEVSILSYYFFATWNSARELQKLRTIEIQNQEQIPSTSDVNGCCLKEKKWDVVNESIKSNQKQNWMKIAMYVNKIVLISFALICLFANIYSVSSELFILTTGLTSDLIGLAIIFRSRFTPPIPA